MKCGFTIKKAKYFSRPDDIEDKVKTFIAKREIFKIENRPFFSTDETSFGRNGVNCYGYSKKGTGKEGRKEEEVITKSLSLMRYTISSLVYPILFFHSFIQTT